jgi:hypothetical protein
MSTAKDGGRHPHSRRETGPVVGRQPAQRPVPHVRHSPHVRRRIDLLPVDQKHAERVAEGDDAAGGGSDKDVVDVAFSTHFVRKLSDRKLRWWREFVAATARAKNGAGEAAAPSPRPGTCSSQRSADSIRFTVRFRGTVKFLLAHIHFMNEKARGLEKVTLRSTSFVFRSSIDVPRFGETCPTPSECVHRLVCVACRLRPPSRSPVHIASSTPSIPLSVFDLHNSFLPSTHCQCGGFAPHKDQP